MCDSLYKLKLPILVFSMDLYELSRNSPPHSILPRADGFGSQMPWIGYGIIPIHLNVKSLLKQLA